MPVFSKLLFVLLVGGGLGVLLWQYATPPQEEAPVVPVVSTPRSYFEPLIPWQIGNQVVFASVADSDDERSLGLSRTTGLPADVVKVFVFGTDERWSFWMKEMEYPIDIVWITASGTIAHIEPNVSPRTYPNSFTPPVPVRYVIETNPGLLAQTAVGVGDTLDLGALTSSNQ